MPPIWKHAKLKNVLVNVMTTKNHVSRKYDLGESAESINRFLKDVSKNMPVSIITFKILGPRGLKRNVNLLLTPRIPFADAVVLDGITATVKNMPVVTG
jgi:hypothetical protein